MVASQVADRIYDDLETLPWPEYFCAVTAMTRLIYQLWRLYYTDGAATLVERSLDLADEVAAGAPVDKDRASSLIAQWKRYFAGDAAQPYVGAHGTLQLFGALPHELANEKTRYAARDVVVDIVLRFPTEGPEPTPAEPRLVRVNLNPDHPEDSIQTRLLRRFERIVELQRSSPGTWTPRSLLDATA